MNERDALISYALNGMTIKELAAAYADLKMENNRLKVRIPKLEAVAEAARNLHEECHRISVETDTPNTQAMACLWRVIEELEKE